MIGDSIIPLTGSLVEPEDAGRGKAGVVTRWLQELRLADKVEEIWRRRADEVLQRYRDEKRAARKGEDDRWGTKFNILRANVETLSPAIYNSSPRPDVRRRWRDGDPVGQAAAIVLDRSLTFCTDDGGLDEALEAATIDMLLPGRGVTRVRYVPLMGQKEAAEKAEEAAEQYSEAEGEAEDDEPAPGPEEDQLEGLEYKAWESVCFEPVQWRDFRRGPGRRWSEVPWIAFRHYLTKEDCEDRFGSDVAECIGYEEISESHDDERDANARDGSGPDHDTFKRATIWEIWDSGTRTVLFIAPCYKDAPLKVEEDPLGLEGFFPIPAPLYAIDQTDRLVPVEDYRAYRDQAEELDRVTGRITVLVASLKDRGIYDSTVIEFDQLMKARDGELVPAQNVAALMEKGGLEKAVWMMPLGEIAAVLAGLYQQREAIKQTIYEITGVADIMRGQTLASETATAQRLKSQFGTLRLQRRQKKVQKYARDLMRIAAELIGEHFSPETLAGMTGLKFPTAQEKVMAHQVLAIAQQAQMQPPSPPPPPQQQVAA